VKGQALRHDETSLKRLVSYTLSTVHGSATFGVIGDIHAEDIRLHSALQFLIAQSVDRLVAVGDIVDGPGDELRCCKLLQTHNVDAVLGNHDRWRLEGRRMSHHSGTTTDPAVEQFLQTLPATRSYDTPSGKLLLCHGLADNDMNGLTADDFGYALETNDELQELLQTRTYRFVINGHTHRRMVRDFGGLGVDVAARHGRGIGIARASPAVPPKAR